MMCSNLTTTHTFPLAIRVCSKPRCFKSYQNSKPQSLRVGSYLKPSLNPGSSVSARPICSSIEFHHSFVKLGSVAKPRTVLSGFNFNVRSTVDLVRGGNISSFSSNTVSGGFGMARGGNDLPWLASDKGKKVKGLGIAKAGTERSSWEVSAEKLEKASGNGSATEESPKRLGKAISDSLEEESQRKVKNGRFKVEDRGNRNGTYNKFGNREKSNRVSMEERRGRESRSRVFTSEERGSRDRRISTVRDSGNRNRISIVEHKEIRDRMVHSEKDWRRDVVETDESEEVEETEAIDDPRWEKIKSRVGRTGYDQKPEIRRWNKQEDWGRKTYKDATESTLPLMVGEGVYGVGPVLASLSAERREFYALYVQEGLDLSSKNRKKRDKKGFENVLRIAEKLGLTIKNISKHDLNMIADNRPHQGLVLDASPLEMVKIKELDPVSVDDRGSLWVALDEVMDPQNLGAIIRSTYFFGASGVVLCAKNSAPLSGVVSKASAGSLELMELRYCKNMMQFLTSSAENGWRVLGGSVSANSVPLREVSPGAPTILVLGNEGTGLRPLVERSCTQLIKIPGNIPVDITAGREPEDVESEDMNQRCSGEEFRSFMAVESLNVSVATGVLLHHFIGNNSAKTE